MDRKAWGLSRRDWRSLNRGFDREVKRHINSCLEVRREYGRLCMMTVEQADERLYEDILKWGK